MTQLINCDETQAVATAGVLTTASDEVVVHNDPASPLTEAEAETMYAGRRIKAYECQNKGICLVSDERHQTERWWVDYTGVPNIPVRVYQGNPPKGTMCEGDWIDLCRTWSACRMDLTDLLNAYRIPQE